MSGSKSKPKAAASEVAAPEENDRDQAVAEWVAKAPEIRGLRRPGVRLKALALLQGIQAKGWLNEDGASTLDLGEDDLPMVAEAVADIDELLASLGGSEYIDFIEQVPMDDGLQMAVLFDLFTGLAGELGKG